MKPVLIIAFILGFQNLFAQEVSLPISQDLCIKHQVYEGYDGGIVSCSLFKSSSNVFSFRLISCDSLLQVKHDSMLYFTGIPLNISQGLSNDRSFFYFLALNYNHSVTTVAIDLHSFEISSAYTPLTNNFDFNFSSSQVFQINSKFFLFGMTKETPSILEVDALTSKQYEIYPRGIGPNSLLKCLSQPNDSTLKIAYTTHPQFESHTCLFWEMDAHRNSIHAPIEFSTYPNRVPTQLEYLSNSNEALVLSSIDGESLHELSICKLENQSLAKSKTIALLNESTISYFLTEQEKNQLKKSQRKNKPSGTGLFTTINYISESDSSYLVVLALYRESARMESHYGNTEYKNTYLVHDGKNYVALLFLELNKQTLSFHFTALPIHISPKPFSENSLIQFRKMNEGLFVRTLSETGAYDFTYTNRSVQLNNRFDFKLPSNKSNEFSTFVTAIGLSKQSFVYGRVQTIRGADKYLVNNLDSYIQLFQFALPSFP